MSASEILKGMEELVGNTSDLNLLFLYDGLQLIREYSSLVLGVLAVIILVFTPLVIGLEVLYINFPTAQDGVQYLSGKYKDKVVAKTLTMIFRDANRAILEANTINTGTSANMIYLKIKLKTVIITALVVGIILGPFQFLVYSLIDIITDIVMNLAF